MHTYISKCNYEKFKACKNPIGKCKWRSVK